MSKKITRKRFESDIINIDRSHPLGRNTRKYPLGGICDVCLSYNERVMWTTIWVCGRCASRIVNNGGKIIKRSPIPRKGFKCELCHRFKPYGLRFYANPKVCEKCLIRIGR